MNNKNIIKIVNLECNIDNLECEIQVLEEVIEELRDELESGGTNLLVNKMKYECFKENHHKFSVNDFQDLMK